MVIYYITSIHFGNFSIGHRVSTTYTKQIRLSSLSNLIMRKGEIHKPEEKDNKPEQHLHGVSNKEQREYEHIKESAEKSGRYGNRAEEVAARTVMKQHKEKQHKS